jgi:hypothetical protein
MGRALEVCTWCGVEVEPDDGYRLSERPGERNAVFCRLEHVVPWAIQGAHWTPGAGDHDQGEKPTTCAHCDAAVGDIRITLTRHRGEYRVPDSFCSVDHVAAWAKAGGRYR